MTKLQCPCQQNFHANFYSIPEIQYTKIIVHNYIITNRKVILHFAPKYDK